MRLGPYQLLSELGIGGMGEVHLAQVVGETPGLEAGTRVALKRIHHQLMEIPGAFERFLREAALGQRVVHPNVVRCYDCDATEVEGRLEHFLVMEYVEGQTLRGLLQELGRVPEELCLHVGREIAKGLEAIHAEGIIHRDLKPENVMITPDHCVKVMDLGVAKLKDEALRLSKTGQFLGSLHYAAPEQFRKSSDELDGRTDLYALGVVLYELAAGEHPHGGESFETVLQRVLNESPRRLSALNPQVSPFFEMVVETLLRKERAERFEDARALYEVLEEGEQGSWWQGEAQSLRAGTRRPLRRIRIARDTALHGREEELAALLAEFEAARGGQGRVVLLEGEMGVGKTRLVDELLARLEQEGTSVDALVGTYPPGGAATATGAFVGAYRERLGPEHLDATLAELLPGNPELATAFASLLRGAGAPTRGASLSKELLQTAILEVTQALAADRPVVLIVEDLQHAPEEGLSLFAALAVAAREMPVLLLGTARRGLPATWHADLERLDHVRSMRLDRLELDGVRDLLADATGGAPVAGEIAGQVLQASGGNPYFVLEILRSLRERRVLHQTSSGAWVTTGVVRELTIPDSVEDLVRARLAGLEEFDRTLLEVAACQGQEFDPLLIAEALDEKAIPVLQRLARLESVNRLVRAKGRRFVFDHAQVEESLYEGLPELLREQYHALLGATLEEREGADGKEVDALQGDLTVALLRHFLLGGEPNRARRYVASALRYLEGVYRHDVAADLGARALAAEGLLEGVDRVDRLFDQAWRLDHLGRREEERAVIDEAAALADELGDEHRRLVADKALGGYLWRVGEVAEGVEVVARSVERAAALGDRNEEAALLGNLGTLKWSLGDYEGAIVTQRRTLVMARELGAWSIEANALGGLGNAFWALGRYVEALDAQREWLDLASAHDDRVGEAMAEGNIGGCLRYLGRFEEARRHIERSLELARTIGQPTVATNAAVSLAGLLSELGRSKEAIATLEAALRLLGDIRYRETEGIVHGMLGQCWLELGALDRAREAYERSLAICQETGDRRNEGHALAGLATLADREGDRDLALERYDRAIELWEPSGYSRGLAHARLQRGYLRGEDGADDFEAACVDARESEQPSIEIAALVYLAQLRGRDADAAVRLFEANAARLPVGDLRDAHLLLWRVTQDPVHLAEAKRLLDELVERAPEAHRESILADVPFHREILEAWEKHGAKGETDA